jgi:hypothetical protein
MHDDIITQIVFLQPPTYKVVGSLPGPFDLETLPEIFMRRGTRMGPELWVDLEDNPAAERLQPGHDYPTNPADREGW